MRAPPHLAQDFEQCPAGWWALRVDPRCLFAAVDCGDGPVSPLGLSTALRSFWIRSSRSPARVARTGHGRRYARCSGTRCAHTGRRRSIRSPRLQSAPAGPSARTHGSDQHRPRCGMRPRARTRPVAKAIGWVPSMSAWPYTPKISPLLCARSRSAPQTPPTHRTLTIRARLPTSQVAEGLEQGNGGQPPEHDTYHRHGEPDDHRPPVDKRLSGVLHLGCPSAETVVHTQADA
jgi:hypothetical protein